MPTETKVKRALAKHTILDAEGKVISAEDNDEGFAAAYGIGYEHIATGGTFTWRYSEAGEDEKRMLCHFGAKTLATNEASAVKQKNGGNVDPTPAIGERFALLRGNPAQWVDRTREGVTIDLDALADAVVEVYAAKGKQYDRTKVYDKLTSDAAWVKSVKSNTEINAAYIAKIGRPTASLDQLATGLE
jgi:hypothetical protein